MQIPAALTNAFNAVRTTVEPAATAAYSTLQPIAFSGLKVFEASPITSTFLAYTAGSKLYAATHERTDRACDKSSVSEIAMTAFICSLVDSAVAPALISNLKSHTLSTLMYAYVGGSAWDAAQDHNKSIGWTELALLLAATGLRFGGPKLATHPYLCWVR